MQKTKPFTIATTIALMVSVTLSALLCACTSPNTAWAESSNTSTVTTAEKALSSVSASPMKTTYNGKVQPYEGAVVSKGSSGKVTYTYYSDKNLTKQVSTPKNAGLYYVKVSLAPDATHTGATDMTYMSIKKAKNKMKASVSSKWVKYSKVKKKSQTVKLVKVSKAKGKVTYKKTSGSSKIKVNPKTGKVTVKKGTKKGIYNIKIKVTDKGTKNYESNTYTLSTCVGVK